MVPLPQRTSTLAVDKRAETFQSAPVVSPLVVIRTLTGILDQEPLVELEPVVEQAASQMVEMEQSSVAVEAEVTSLVRATEATALAASYPSHIREVLWNGYIKARLISPPFRA
jgi:hypothetical protein